MSPIPFRTQNRRVLVLDGGLGTTVEAYNPGVTSSPLWSTTLVRDAPDVLLHAHQSFLEAGADIILTATYQACHEAFDRAGYSPTEAGAAMRKAVSLANDSRALPKTSVSSRPLLGLALGPYGAQMTQEYGGCYPPPFGPSNTDNGPTNTAFSSQADEEEAESELADFHYTRLLVFAKDSTCWDMIDLIAFETVPLLREGRAIRRAMSRLQIFLTGLGLLCPPWWISYVFPDGLCPQQISPDGARLPPRAIAEGTYSAQFIDGAQLAMPSAIGVNCTKIRYMSTILKEFAHGLQTAALPVRPWLVVYPDGGQEYNVLDKTWRSFGSDGTSAAKWASEVAGLVHAALDTKHADGRELWEGVIVGGCCKTGVEEIRALRTVL